MLYIIWLSWLNKCRHLLLSFRKRERERATENRSQNQHVVVNQSVCFILSAFSSSPTHSQKKDLASEQSELSQRQDQTKFGLERRSIRYIFCNCMHASVMFFLIDAVFFMPLHSCTETTQKNMLI